MKKFMLPLSLSLVLFSCGNSYDKSPDDWKEDVCNCSLENGPGAQECQDLIKELKTYYAEEDGVSHHDKAMHYIMTDCPEVVTSQFK